MGQYAEQYMQEESIRMYGVNVYEETTQPKKKNARQRRSERRAREHREKLNKELHNE